MKKGIKKLFVNSNLKLRSGWKIIITLAAYIITELIMIGLTNSLFALYCRINGKSSLIDSSNIGTSLNAYPVFYVMRIALQTFGAVAVVILIWRLFDKQPASALGFTNIKKGSVKILTGFLAGALSMSFVFVFLLLTGSISLEGSLASPNISFFLLSDFLVFIGVGISEEAFSRGYCMSVMKQTGSLPLIILVPALIFSMLHAGNNGVSPLGLANIFLVGILLALMFLRTGSLWMPIGYHTAWNYFQGTIFGLNVSGMDLPGMYKTKMTAANLLNGGAFGPEGGLAVTIIIAAGIALEYYLSSRSQAILPVQNEQQ